MRKFVGYSWKKQDLTKIEKILKSRGFETELVDNWEKVEFIRDGSLSFLGKTLIVKQGKKIVAYVTPKKLIAFEPLDLDYPFPISLREGIFVLVLILIWWWYL